MLLNGPVFSLITPFKDDLSIDYYSLEKYLNLLLASKSSQLYSMAFNGKYETLDSEEIICLNTFITAKVKAISPKIPVICGDEIFCSAKRTLHLLNHYFDIGCDLGSVLFGERYYSNNQIIDFFNYLTSNTKLKILVHEMKLQNGAGGPDINWPIDALSSILKNDSIIAIKEDSKDDDFLKSIGDQVNNSHFVISGGGMKRWRCLQRSHNYQSWLNGIGVVFPEIETFYYQCYLSNEYEKCSYIEEHIEAPFFDLLNNTYWHQLTKAGLAWRGVMEYHERLPMVSCTSKQYEYIHNSLEIISSNIQNIGCNLIPSISLKSK